MPEDTFREKPEDYSKHPFKEILDKLGGPPEPRRLNLRNISISQFGHLTTNGPAGGVTDPRFQRQDLGDRAVPRTKYGRMAIQTEKAEVTPVHGTNEINMPWHTTKYFEDPRQRRDKQW